MLRPLIEDLKQSLREYRGDDDDIPGADDYDPAEDPRRQKRVPLWQIGHPDFDDDSEGERTHIDILDWDDYVKVMRYSERDDAREDRPEAEKFKSLDVALAELKKDKEITDADITKIQKAVKAGTVFSKGGGVILTFSKKTGKLTDIDEA
jgi:hypothetical protein